MAETRKVVGIDTGPATVHELITRNKVDDLAIDMEKAHAQLRQEMAAVRAELSEVRRLIYGLIFTVAGAIVVQVVLRLAGWL